MSNIGNYGVNPGSNVGYNNQYNNNYQPQPQNNQVNGYGNDGYAFNLSNNNNAPVPDVKVGFWDKITTTFDDVHRSDENLSKFKAFEAAMSQNPGGYLKPGSSETTRIRDLQKKLSFVGFNVNVNGEFGSATEKAVINFKKSVGINDGYLNKSGQFAVTPIVTPQMWNILNSQVATRLNPGANPSNGYAAPITKEELDWAKQLQSKIRQYGYNPTQSERQKYESIFQRQQMNVNIQNGSFNPTAVQPPTREELEWAKGLILKMSQNGYKPNAQEQQRYSDIQKRQQISKNNLAEQNNSAQQNNVVQQPPAVSQQEYNWAVELMNKVKQGYKASPQEEAKYNDIFSRMQTQNAQNTQTTNTPPSQEELKWASDLEAKVKQGYNASPQERAKYDEIFARYNANPNSGNEVKPPTPVVKPTDSEIAWAMDLEKRSQSGYQPNQNELTIYNDIASRLEAFNAQQNSASPEEMAWASMMYSKMQGGYKPSAEELGILNNIQAKISGNSQQNNNVNPQQNNNTAQNNTPEPQQNNFSSPFQGVNDFSYNNSTISEFRKAFSGSSFIGNRVPYLSPEAGAQAAKQYGFNSVQELQSAVGASVDGKFGPETYFKVMKALEAQNGGNPQPVNNSNQNQPVQNSGTVSQADLDWAVELQSKWQQGYKPSQQEISKYEDIYNRYNNGGAAVNNSAPQNIQVNYSNNVQNNSPASSGQAVSQEEMQWANELQTKWQQGYQPNQQEIAKYTDIYNRAQAGETQPTNNVQSVNPTQQNNNTQATNYTQQNNNAPTTYVDSSSADPDLQWALQLLDKYQQGYQPTDQELQRYEQIIAKNQSVTAYP